MILILELGISILDNYNIMLQAVGVVAGIGDSVKHLKVGTAAAIMTYGSYTEFTVVRHSIFV